MKSISLILKTIQLIPVTGTVLEASKNMETKVSGSGGGGGSFGGTGATRPVRITSKTTVHDQIFLKDVNGMEHSYQLTDFHLACREGNEISVIEAKKGNSQKGYPVGVANHSTNKIYTSASSLKKVGSPNVFLYVLAYIIILFFMPKSSGDWSITALFIFGAFILCYFIVSFIQVRRIKNEILNNNFQQA